MEGAPPALDLPPQSEKYVVSLRNHAMKLIYLTGANESLLR